MNRIIASLIIGVTCLGLLITSCNYDASQANVAIPDIVSYNFHIRPILSDKCFACHGPDAAKRESGLRLDIGDSALIELPENKGHFAIVPGYPERSELIKRVIQDDPEYKMPPPGAHLGALSDYEVSLFEKWIKQGAKYEKHWAFMPPEKTTLPKVKNKDWAREPLDFFVLQKMEQFGLKPAAEANHFSLLKRLSLDITGLPPTDSLMDAFDKDHSEEAYERVLTFLLESPHYGEKMGLLWCDIGRYSDSYGYQDDNIRTQWPWRDWVIHALNRNMSYDSFLVWQLAGDMLPHANAEHILATGFLRNHKYTEEGGVIEEEYRVEYLVDKVKTFSKGILGLTVECAQCHDHKYDPISQQDYYQMFAFFNNTTEVGYEGDVSQSKPAKNPILTITESERKSLLRFIQYQDTGNLYVSVMGERKEPRKTFILNRGLYSLPGEEVVPGAPNDILPFDTTRFARNRLGLAKWTVDRSHPLTARFWVNLVWQELFGTGLVKSAGDFGMQGDLPSHPELLDWLAVDFMENGWDNKRLIRNIVSSATYRQSVAMNSKQLKRDPENVWLSSSPRVRMKAEMVRDWALATAGLLNRTIGGASVKPYQPKGLWESATSGRGELATYQQDTGNLLYRRGLYTFIKLTVPPPSMAIFDASNRDQCEVQRLVTNTPLQALVMLNDPTVMEASRVLAQLLLAKGDDDNSSWQAAFKRIVCRPPNAFEIKKINEYYGQQLTAYKSGQLMPDAMLGQGAWKKVADLPQYKVAALMKTILLIYNMEETTTKI